MSLRARLVLAFLALALIPTAVFTVFTFDQLNRAISRWYRPGVDRALESAVEVTQSSLARLEGTVLIQADEWAEHWEPEALQTARLPDMKHDLGATGVDFLQVYAPSDTGWRRIAHVTAEGLLETEAAPLGREIDAALAADRLIRSRTGTLAGVARTGTGQAIVVGMRVSPDFFAEVERVTNGMTYYRQLGIAVNVWRPVVWVLVGAVTLLIVVLAVFVARRLADGMSHPIHELADAIERVSAGDLGTRVTPRGAVELRSLGSSFNLMTGRLEEARLALQEAEREAAWRDVARKLAHEIKNMLTPIQLSMQLLERHAEAIPEGPRAAVERSLQAALSELDHLTHLAEQFSQYARLPEPRFERLELGEVARAVAGLCDGARTVVECAACDPVEIRGDRLLLTRAIHNLVINACEASPDGGLVELRTSVSNGTASVEVLDRGTGVPQELRGREFDPYVSTRGRGSGLGLSLVRDIARQHGGTIALEDRTGGGARARLTLPAAGPATERT